MAAFGEENKENKTYCNYNKPDKLVSLECLKKDIIIGDMNSQNTVIQCQLRYLMQRKE